MPLCDGRAHQIASPVARSARRPAPLPAAHLINGHDLAELVEPVGLGPEDLHLQYQTFVRISACDLEPRRGRWARTACGGPMLTKEPRLGPTSFFLAAALGAAAGASSALTTRRAARWGLAAEGQARSREGGAMWGEGWRLGAETTAAGGGAMSVALQGAAAHQRRRRRAWWPRGKSTGRPLRLVCDSGSDRGRYRCAGRGNRAGLMGARGGRQRARRGQLNLGVGTRNERKRSLNPSPAARALTSTGS